MPKRFTKTFTIRVDSPLYTWLKNRKPDTVREILISFKEGRVIKTVDEKRRTASNYSPTSTVFLLNEYEHLPCSARFLNDNKFFCKTAAWRRPREIMCIEECVACLKKVYEKRGLIDPSKSTDNGIPLKDDRRRIPYRKRDPFYEKPFDTGYRSDLNKRY